MRRCGRFRVLLQLNTEQFAPFYTMFFCCVNDRIEWDVQQPVLQNLYVKRSWLDTTDTLGTNLLSVRHWQCA